MSLNECVVEGTIQPDGTLVLDEPTQLPAGRVQVTVQPLSKLPCADPLLEMLQSIWAAQKARRHIPRSSEDIEAERHEFRATWEKHQTAIDQLQEQSRSSRDPLS